MALTDKLTAIADAIRAKTGGTAALTLDQMPTEIANIQTGGSGGKGDPIVCETVVDIAAVVSVESFEYNPETTHALYNGVRLPVPPIHILRFPYAWIRKDDANGNYNFVFGQKPWYFDGSVMVCGNNTSLPYYSIPIATYADATEWTYTNDGGGTNFGIADNRTVLWSNHDIPNGSATATDIYFKGSEPVPTE
jgi:hypothetical protein